MGRLVMAIVAVLGIALVLLPLPVLTAVGAHRRGVGPPLTLLAGLFFPITWTAWYLLDEHPYRRSISA